MSVHRSFSSHSHFIWFVLLLFCSVIVSIILVNSTCEGTILFSGGGGKKESEVDGARQVIIVTFLLQVI